MSSDNTGRTELNRRTFLGATGAGLVGTGLSSAASARSSDDGDGNGGGGNGGDAGGNGGDRDEHTVTLISGQTIHVTDVGDERIYAVEDGGDEVYEVIERERGTYIVPDSVDTDLYDEELFNVDGLIEQGYTDAETDATPVVVGLDPDAPNAADASAFGAESRELSSIDAVATAVPKDEADVADAMARSTAVERVLLDAKYEAELDVSAPAIGAAAARDAFGVDGDGVTIAVVDSGVDADHPDFGDRVVDEVDFTGEGTGDGSGHGTHVAGIAAGDGTESDGEYVGVAPGADIVDVKTLGADGSGQLSDIVAGIEYAVDAGADVINMSLGGVPSADDPMEDAVDWAHGEGVAVVNSAGNATSIFGPDYQDDLSSPGHAEGAITVGATDHTGDEPELADFSAWGPSPFEYRPKPDVLAPGVAVTATGSAGAGEDPYADKSGTSMSAPMVSGLAALLLEQDGERGPEDVRSLLVSTAREFGDGDIYQEGAGEVDAVDALGTDVVVHDAVTSLGVYDGPQEDEATINVENVGDETVDLEASASLYNVQAGSELDDNVSVSPSDLTVEPGETADVTLTVDATDTGGFNSGVLEFEADDATYRSIFGFTTGFEVTVEKIPHENSEGGTVAGDSVWVWSHDGEINADGTLGADGTYSTLMFHEGGTFTVWSEGQLEPNERQENAPVNSPSGDPVHVVESGVHIDADDDHVVLDENDTVPRELDASAIADREPFTWREYAAYMYGTAEGAGRSYARRFIGDYRVRTAHVSPIDEDAPTNVANDYFMAPTDAVVGETAFASPEVYYLHDGTLSVDEDGEPFVVDPDELAAEHVTYHLDDEDQIFTVFPGVSPADTTNFPSILLTQYGTDEPDLPAEQTWYRTDEGRYADDWDDAEDDSNYGISTNYESFVPEAGATYDTGLNRGPLTGQFSGWSIDDGEFAFEGHWYTDQTDVKRTALRWDHDNRNEYAVAVDGETVLEGDGIGSAFSEDGIEVDPGSTVELSIYGNALRTFRGDSTVTRYETTYDADGDDTPPQFPLVEVTGLNALNEVTAGSLVVFVSASTDLETFDAYSAGADVEEPPFDGGTGWNEAEVVYDGGDVYGVRVDATGYDGLSLAFRGTDAAGNVVESTSIDGVSVLEWADASVPLTVRPDGIDVGSNGVIPVEIEATDDVDPHDVDPDSLRFGAPDAVADGDGAPARSVQKLGTGTLQAQFRASDTGYDDDRSPAAATLVAELEDGTVVSGADVVDDVEGA